MHYIKLLGHKIKIKSFHITFADDENILLENWYLVCSRLFKKFGSIYFTADFFKVKKFHSSLQIIYRPLIYLIYDVKNNLKSLPSLGSELSLKTN